MSDLIGGFWYLATPYTNYPNGLDASFTDSCLLAARLTEMGLIVYSPVVYCHAIASHGNLNPKDHDLWMAIDRPMVDSARGLIVGMLSGWDTSRGVSLEIGLFKRAKKPILRVDPLDIQPDSTPQSARSQPNVVQFTDTQKTTSPAPTS